MLAQAVPIAKPEVVSSFVLAAVSAALTAALTAQCCTDVSSWYLASRSSYTFAYMTLGEGATLLGLRNRFKSVPQAYRPPSYPLIPILSIASCGYLVFILGTTVYQLCAVRQSLATIFSFLYGRKRAQHKLQIK